MNELVNIILLIIKNKLP